MPAPEALARAEIDAQLAAAGWIVQDFAALNIHAGSGVAVREFPLAPGFGFADYLLYVDARAVGIIEAKRSGTTLTGVVVERGTLHFSSSRCASPMTRTPRIPALETLAACQP